MACLLFIGVHLFTDLFTFQFERSAEKRDSRHSQDQVLRGEAQVPTGAKAVRREGRDRAVFSGPPQHDGENQGVAAPTRSDARKAGQLSPA